MKIDLLCNDGSPLGVTVKDIYGEGMRGIGIGGAELALLTMCEAWAKAGHDVTLYNDPTEIGASPFEQRHIHTFRAQDDRDVLIVFRSPNPRAIGAKGLKVWWSCDQFTVGDFRQFAPSMDRVVVISPFHADHFKREYQILSTIVIDLPVRVDEYTVSTEKIPGRCIFTSVPDRGLQILHACWPLIKRDVPEASLLITSDYRLWGVSEPMNWEHRKTWAFANGVTFKGAVPRRELVQEELKAQVLTYPGIYDELFCISVAEAQVAGVYTVTSAYGSLPTTNMSMVLVGKPTDPSWVERFVAEVVMALKDENYLRATQSAIREKATSRFHPDNIIEQWNEKVFK